MAPTGLGDLIAVLQHEGFQTLGPVLRDDRVIGIGEVSGATDLPRGVGDEQRPGSYRITSRDDDAYFAAAVQADTWKRYLFPPLLPLIRSRATPDGPELSSPDPDPPKRAFLGVRGCDLAAITIQDRVFLRAGNSDPHYAARREGLFLVAVDCSHPAENCFCSSQGTGPAAGPGADLVLTELFGEHRFVVSVHTEAGRRIASQLSTTPATRADLEAVAEQHRAAVERITKTLEPTELPQQLAAAADHPGWDDVAQRCLSCANCTLACPTCFCFDVTDETDLATGTADRIRRWGSCFEHSHSYLHGGPARSSTSSRYRQWLTHKLSTWWEQFGTSGCTGCGRCITWCPVGIDITEEAARLRLPAEEAP